MKAGPIGVVAPLDLVSLVGPNQLVSQTKQLKYIRGRPSFSSHQNQKKFHSKGLGNLKSSQYHEYPQIVCQQDTSPRNRSVCLRAEHLPRVLRNARKHWTTVSCRQPDWKSNTLQATSEQRDITRRATTTRNHTWHSSSRRSDIQALSFVLVIL